MRRQELSGSVHCGGGFVEDRGVGLEHVGHPRGDVECDFDVGRCGCSREADGVIEENLVSPAWMIRCGRPDRSANMNMGLVRARAASCPDV
jgi:hypothetical protein